MQCMQVLRTHALSTYKHMHDGALACSLQRRAPTEPLRHVNLPSELFKQLQFRLISKIYEFGSQQITHPLISPLSLSQRSVEGVGEVGFLPSWAWTSTAAGGRGCQPIRRCCCHWLSGSRPQIISASQTAFSPKCPPDTEGKKIWMSAERDVSSQIEVKNIKFMV